MILRDVESAKRIIDSGIDLKSINVGNINLDDDRIKILPNLWLTPQEASDLKELHGRGIELDVRTVPTDKKIDLIKLIEEKYL